MLMKNEYGCWRKNVVTFLKNVETILIK
jgi:hypothetical protein